MLVSRRSSCSGLAKESDPEMGKEQELFQKQTQVKLTDRPGSGPHGYQLR